MAGGAGEVRARARGPRVQLNVDAFPVSESAGTRLIRLGAGFASAQAARRSVDAQRVAKSAAFRPQQRGANTAMPAK